MKCVEREELFDYAHGLLERRDADVRGHLVECPVCRGVLEEYRKLDAVLEESHPPQVSPRFDARLRQALVGADLKEPSRLWSWLASSESWLPVGVGGLVALLVIAASLAVLRITQHSLGPRTAARQRSAQGNHAGAPLSAQSSSEMPGEDELTMYENLPVLEDYDMLANFDLLSELRKGGKKLAN